MSEFNKSYRIRTDVGKDKALKVKLDQQYDILEIMSLKIDQKNLYKLHTSNYGVIAGRVLANGGFGIPNAKISVFIGIDNQDMNDIIKSIIYPYNQTSSKDKNNVRYNLLPNEQLNDCHTIIGTFPSKQLVLDNDILLEIFEKYYKFTTKTNESGDYMIFGVPTGVQTIHVDIDLSDVGILSQKPRDMIYKGYNINQFENPNKFKYDTNLNSLAQVISEDTVTEVIPFWGDEEEGTIGITRCDVNVNYKFEPTCVFMGSVVSDSPSNGFSTKCIPTPGMGAMDELTTGSGTIEMIRKTPSGDVEEVQIQGTQLINGDGIWCYQIPMNLDYMKTDEFGKMVPTDDPSKGIATRTRVRFRMSMQDGDNDIANIHRGKILVPHNPSNNSEIDYDFGTNTKDYSYRDLLWNCVYSVKSYIPRIQKGSNWKNEKFTGFKRVNYYNDNNPLPYNNIRIKIPFMYSILCMIINIILKIIGLVNAVILFLQYGIEWLRYGYGTSFITIDGELCSDKLDNYCIIPGIKLSTTEDGRPKCGLIARTLLRFIHNKDGIIGHSDLMESSSTNPEDGMSIDKQNKSNDKTTMSAWFYDMDEGVHISGVVVTNSIDYIIHCIELNLAQEYKVIQFDFYNDWVNGLIYIPRWMRNVTKKRTFLFWTIKESQIKGCNEYFNKNNINIVQQCGLEYKKENDNNISIITNKGCKDNSNNQLVCHKSSNVRLVYKIFQGNGGVIVSSETIKKQKVYYYKPIEGKVKLYSTDIILLGNLNPCNIYGIPNFFNELISSTYQMPPNMVFTDSDIDGPLYTAKPNYDDFISLVRYDYKACNKNWFDSGDVYCASDSGVLVSHINFRSNLRKMGEDDIGSTTLISGIDWVYNGPGQGESSDKIYHPGGHFLGLSCVNSQTTIKTCVNLSRICELNVNMSQRKELNDVENREYATVPTGFISFDEINSGNGRRIFATLNHKKLIISENYHGYDFMTINPNNFGGELKNDIMNVEGYNKLVGYNYVDTIWEPLNDNYTSFDKKTSTYVNETRIRRTGEYTDNEYIRFRFGDKEFEKRFLLTNSFPLYENSFYFYFGLHDGKTAVDEFKKQYYANCTLKDDEKMINKIEVYPENNENNVYMKYCTFQEIYNNNNRYYQDGVINLICYIDINDNNIDYKYYYDWVKNEDEWEVNSNNEIKISTNTKGQQSAILNSQGLSEGDITLKIMSQAPGSKELKIEKSIKYYIKGQKYDMDIVGNKFNKNYTINVNDFITKYKELGNVDNLIKQGGYIKINKKFTVDISENEEYEVIKEIRNITNDYKIIIKPESSDVNLEITCEFDNNNIDTYTLKYNDKSCTLFSNSDDYIYIPVPYGNIWYDINLYYINKTNQCKYIDKVFIINGSNLDFKFNGVRYSDIHNIIPEKEEWWSSDNFWNSLILEDKNNLLNAIFVNELVDEYGEEIKYNIPIVVETINPPTTETLCVTTKDENGDEIKKEMTQPLSVSINNLVNTTDYSFYEYQCKDNNNFTCPENNYFKFPIIFKPLFIRGDIYNDETQTSPKIGFNITIYNGIREDNSNNFILELENRQFKLDITKSDYYNSDTCKNYIIGNKEYSLACRTYNKTDNIVSDSIINNFNIELYEINNNGVIIEDNKFNYLNIQYLGTLFYRNYSSIKMTFDEYNKNAILNTTEVSNGIYKKTDWTVNIDNNIIKISPNNVQHNNNKNNQINFYTKLNKSDYFFNMEFNGLSSGWVIKTNWNKKKDVYMRFSANNNYCDYIIYTDGQVKPDNLAFQQQWVTLDTNQITINNSFLNSIFSNLYGIQFNDYIGEYNVKVKYITIGSPIKYKEFSVKERR